MRWIVGDKASHGCAASLGQVGRFETKWLAAEKMMVQARRPPRGVVLDMDSSSLQTHPGCAMLVSLRLVHPQTPRHAFPMSRSGRLGAMAHRRGHAIVIGASMGGLLAARAVAEHYDRVTVIERDELPEAPEPRKGVHRGSTPMRCTPGDVRGSNSCFRV
jgi:hypothetical protein